MINIFCNSDAACKVISALTYGIVSIMITWINKTILTDYRFPSFTCLALGQITAIMIILLLAHAFKFIKLPAMSRKVFKSILPLIVYFMGNMILGLGGTQSLSLPMLTALRRITLLITLVLQMIIMKSKPNWKICGSVFITVTGAFIAACFDLSFKLDGYIYTLLANIMSALYGITIQKQMESDRMNKFGLMFYTSLISILPVGAYTWLTGDFNKILTYEEWNNLWFITCFLLSCVLGFLLTFSTYFCQEYNSALTTGMVGSVKNTLVSFIGMFTDKDYIFSVLNCFGIGISAVGSILYTIAELFSGAQEKADSTKNLENIIVNPSPPISQYQTVECKEIAQNGNL